MARCVLAARSGDPPCHKRGYAPGCIAADMTSAAITSISISMRSHIPGAVSAFVPEPSPFMSPRVSL